MRQLQRRLQLVVTASCFSATVLSQGAAAEPLLVPWPKEIRMAGGCERLDTEAVITAVFSGAVAPEAASVAQFGLNARCCIALPVRNLRTPVAQKMQILVIGRGEVNPEEVVSASLVRLPEKGAEEAYCLTSGQGRVLIAARGPAGLLNGVQTLLQLVSKTERGLEVPDAFIRDWPVLTLRAFMLDPARLKHRYDYYDRCLDVLSRYKVNCLQLHLSDDEGFALQLKSHPGLATAHAFTQDEMRAFVRKAQRLGIEVIPEVESLGHCGSITRNPTYRHLAVEPNSTTLNPFHPDTLKLLADIYAECAEIFPSPLFHAGLDEVGNLSQSPESQKAYAEANVQGTYTDVEWVYAQHVNNVSGLLKRHGKRLVVWGDMLLSHKKAVDLIPKDLIINDWHYHYFPQDQYTVFFKEKGFEIIGSPSLMCGDYRVMPSARNLQNVAGFAELAERMGLRGLTVTVWQPKRYLVDACWLPFAESAAMMWEGIPVFRGAFNRERFLDAYVKNAFGLEADDKLRRAIERMIGLVPSHKELTALMSLDDRGFAALLDSAQLPQGFDPDYAEELIKDAVAVEKTLRSFEDRVALGREEYATLLLAARIEIHVAELVRTVQRGMKIPFSATDRERLGMLRAENDAILEAVKAQWRPWLYEESLAELSTGKSKHNLLRYFIQTNNALKRLMAMETALAR